MTPGMLLEQFDVMMKAPNGVQKLRELILQLAVRGKLVQQDPEDEPACVVLTAIRSQRRSQERSGGTRAEAVPPQVESYAIPSTWAWARLADVGRIVGGGTPRTDRQEFWTDGEGIPWLTPADLNGLRDKYIGAGRRRITQAGLESSAAQLLPANAVLFSSRAPIGYVAMAANPLATNQGFKSCVADVPQMSEYIYRYLQAVAPEVERHAPGTTFKEVSGKLVARIPIAVPPLSEQRRIVAKVDELLTLCDELEAQLTRVQDKASRLASSFVHRITAA